MSYASGSATTTKAVTLASIVSDRESAKALLVVAATIVIPYALCPLIMIWAVVYFGALGVKRLLSWGSD
ncbi:hypothetical protein [Rhodococcus sp. Q]|uniref:hypothetical protein n=1 Tax=Rhodococcus sp. Q TaxID=2502252 RepID=UPI0010F7A939|nr:hypothetical protein [Rhodococcus sp. Q]